MGQVTGPKGGGVLQQAACLEVANAGQRSSRYSSESFNLYLFIAAANSHSANPYISYKQACCSMQQSS